MGWTKVCGTARSGIWVPKGNARTCMFPANLDGWDGSLRDRARPPGLRQGTTVCVHTSMDMEQRSDRKLITPSGMGLLVCGAGSHLSYHLGTPVQVHVSVGIAITNPCSAHRMRLSS